MSGHDIHVHGAHDHAVEHEAQKGGMAQQIAIFTAILATVGAIVSFFGGDTQNKAMLYKNEAVLKRAEASDQWNFYQAKSMKQNLAELASAITADSAKAEAYRKEAQRYAGEKKEIEKDARTLEAQAKAYSEKSGQALHPHHFLSISMTLLQIAIALASITVLTQKRWLLGAAAVSAFSGAVLGIVAWI
jgi:ABC-type multidrug transport system fused ATPase/permease subunit